METKSLNSRQKLQEVEYQSAYHWNISANTRKGCVFYGYYRMALDLAGNLTGKEVLDAGCGDGYFTSLILEKNPASVTGIDYSEKAVSFAKKLVPKANFAVGDINRMPFEDKRFDSIFLIETLEHLKERQEAVKELERVLKPDGRLIVSVPSVNAPVIDKHEGHFSKETLEDTFGRFFKLERIVGQDRGGIFHKLFWSVFRLWKNRFLTVKPMINFWTLILYPLLINKSGLKKARRLIASFRKI